MIKNTIACFLLLICCSTTNGAKRKKTVHLSTEKASYSYVTNGSRVIGNVYECSIKTFNANIKIDSVWFGATPVPCDVYIASNKQKTDTCTLPGSYFIKANKDLYKNFNSQIDSSAAYASFKAPLAFKGDAVLMYWYQGKRYYSTIYKVAKQTQKQHRQ